MTRSTSCCFVLPRGHAEVRDDGGARADGRGAIAPSPWRHASCRWHRASAARRRHITAANGPIRARHITGQAVLGVDDEAITSSRLFAARREMTYLLLPDLRLL